MPSVKKTKTIASPERARNPAQSTDPDIIASFKALRRAARKARELGLQTGTPVWVMIRGRIVDITKRKPKRRASRPRAK